MKWIITIATVIVLSLAVTAFADEDPMVKPIRDLGIEIYEASMVPQPVMAASPAPQEEVVKDVGTVLYESYLARETELASRGRTGEAGGGPAVWEPVDEHTRIFESIFVIGGSDLP
jgi:hypothetical protein